MRKVKNSSCQQEALRSQNLQVKEVYSQHTTTAPPVTHYFSHTIMSSVVAVDYLACETTPHSHSLPTSINITTQNRHDFIKCSRCRGVGCDIELTSCGCSYHAVSTIIRCILARSWRRKGGGTLIQHRFPWSYVFYFWL
jgi:hypothetical protein